MAIQLDLDLSAEADHHALPAHQPRRPAVLRHAYSGADAQHAASASRRARRAAVVLQRDLTFSFAARAPARNR